MTTRIQVLPALIASLCLAGYAVAQTGTFARPQAHIVKDVDEFATVRLTGNVHPSVAFAAASQTADSSTPMDHIILYLKGDTNQEAQLALLIAKQNDPSSSLYHQYLTPKDFGAQFGVAQADIEKVTAWLLSHGFTVTQIPSGNRAVVFSGTVAQIAEAFKTEIRRFTVGGSIHYANVSDPQIPAALAPAVGGIVKLHDFRHGHSITGAKLVSAAQIANPQFTSGSNHYLAPADYSTIYDIGPLYSAGINGSGQTIAVLARSNIYMSDVQTFRTDFGLKVNNPQIVITNTDPGVLQGDSVETTLDTEWSGAVAPNANVKVIVSASTSSADGIDLSALYAVNNNVAPIITLSYGSCEAGMGTSELAFYNSLWKQAASQGQTVLVSSGDSGAAGCDYGSVAVYGQGINGLCSSPYATCVGGTQFVEGTNPGQYWLPGNNATYGSAISYLPESIWNESGSNGGSGLWSGGGGASAIYAKPTWQAGPGVPADGKRDVPDVSLTAAAHDGYLILLYGQLNSVGGTSAAAPSFAGMMALVNQKTNAHQGAVNPILYPLATKQASGGAAVFHDIKTGNNSVPGATGFSATTGYDLASGLGSVDANVLVNHWTDASTPTASLAISASATAITVKLGKSTPATLTSVASGLSSPVVFTVTGAPSGVTASFSSNSIASPGSGSVTLTIAATSSATPGTYSLAVIGTSGSQTAKVTISVLITAPTFTLSPISGSMTVAAGATGQLTLTTTPQNGFNSSLTFSASGLPTGVTVAFSPVTLAGASAASSTVSLMVAKTVKSGSYSIAFNAVGGGITQSTAVTLIVPILATCKLTANPTSLTLIMGQAAAGQISCGAVQGAFTAPLTLILSGAPMGVTAKLAATTITAGSSTTLSVNSLSTTVAGSYALSVTATSGTFSQTLSIPLVVPSPNFTLVAGASSVSAFAGSTAQLAVTTTPQNGFNSAIAPSVSGLPAGVTGAFSSNSGGTSNLALTVSRTAKAGTYPLTINAVGGGITHTASVSLVITVAPACSLAANPGSVSLAAGQSTSVQISCTVTQGTFTAPLAFSVSGAPAGIAAQIASGSATMSTILNIASILSTSAGTSNLSLTAAGNGYTQTIIVPLTVSVPSTFALTASDPSLTMKTGSSRQLSVAIVRYGAFNSTVTLSVGGLPVGVSAAFSNSALAASGTGTLVATLSASSAAKTGTYTVTVSATGGGQTHTLPLTLIVSPNQDFAFAVNLSALTIPQGGAGKVIASSGNFTGGFNSTIVLTVSGLPPGGNWANAGATTGNNMVNISYSFTAASSTPVGTYPVTITASGAGILHTAAIQMTITAALAHTRK